MMLRSCSFAGLAVSVLSCVSTQAATLPIVSGVEWQPLAAQIERVAQAAEFIGEPLTQSERLAVDAALKEKDATKLQAALDPRCLFDVHRGDGALQIRPAQNYIDVLGIANSGFVDARRPRLPLHSRPQLHTGFRPPQEQPRCVVNADVPFPQHEPSDPMTPYRIAVGCGLRHPFSER